jgi:hypothetical protein
MVTDEHLLLVVVDDDKALGAFVEAVEAGARSAQTGKLHSNEEAMEILDSFGE